MLKKGLFVVLLFCLGTNASAFQFDFLPPQDTLTAKQWTLEDGLPVNTIGQVAQDSIGFIWISTYDGLVKFDGLNFEVFNYSNTPEMPHNRTTDVYFQTSDSLWVPLEYGGVMLFSNGEIQHFGSQNGFTDSDLTQIHSFSGSRMFFITNEGLYVVEDGNFRKFYNGESPGQNQIHSLFEDDDKTIWVATNDGLLHFTANGALINEYSDPRETRDNRFLEIKRNKDGNVIVGTYHGLYELQGDRFIIPQKYTATTDYAIYTINEDAGTTVLTSSGEVFYFQDGVTLKMEESGLKPNEVYKDFYEDSEGNLWLIGNVGTLGLLRGKNIVAFDATQEISNLYYNSVFEDREGNLWIGTSRNGLFIVSKSKVRTIGTPEGLSGNNILGLFEDSRGRYWVGTRSDGLNLITEEGITTYSADDGLSADIIHTIGEDRNGNIWVGHYQEGLDKISGSEIENYKPGNNLEINDIRAIYSDSDETFWLGTYDGLINFDPVTREQTVYKENDGLSGVKIRYITQAPDDAIWSGSLDGGVSRFHNGEFTNYTTDEGLSSNNIRSIYIDETDSNTVWIGTENNGLNRLRDGEIRYITTEDGLPDHIIHWISQDDKGWLWMSSNRGIFKVNKEELNAYLDNESEIFTLLHFGREEGMRNPEANGAFQEAGLRTDNQFWFSTQEGVAIFSQQVSTADSVAPNVIIKGVDAAGNSYTSQEVLIGRGTKSFTVNFHALTYPATDKTRFRYRLEGYEEGWSEVVGTRSASYQNIPAGTYTFEVISANNDGVWSEEPTVSAITVQPFIYQEPWFILLTLVLIAVGYYGASQIRYKYLLKRQKELEETIQNQTAELRKEKKDLQKKNQIIKKQAAELEESNQTKDKFFSLIAHDLRNPFQGLVGLSELILMDLDEGRDPELVENVQHLYSSARSLHDFVEDLLSWASLQNDKMSVEPEPIDINELGVQVLDLFNESARQKNIELIFESSTETAVHADRNMLKTIIRNLISNAIKFTEAQGTVSLQITDKASFHIIKVQDDGIGMDEKVVEKLLHIESDISREGTQNEKGSGLGLLICKEMIDLHDGELLIESEKHKGTTFTLKLPFRKLS